MTSPANNANPGTEKTETWMTRSVCGQAGCVAAVSVVDLKNRSGPPSVKAAFDLVNGRWLGVREDSGDCKGRLGTEATRWYVTDLQPQPDGTLTGRYTFGATDGGCLDWQTIKLTRTGDVDPSVPLDDPSGWPARVPSPAQGLHGTYILTKTEKLQTPTQVSTTYAGETQCLRAGDKCVTFFTEPGSGTNLIMAFAEGKWTMTDTADEMTCDPGGFDSSHQKETAEYPLPQPVVDPFPVITGHGSVSWYGQTCGGDYKYDAKLERKGD